MQKVADERGYQIVRNLGSHGVGRSIHEEPSYVPVDNPREKRLLREGMVFTIEPFFTTGEPWVEELADGWTLAVDPPALVAQFEHTIMVTRIGGGDSDCLIVSSDTQIDSQTQHHTVASFVVAEFSQPVRITIDTFVPSVLEASSSTQAGDVIVVTRQQQIVAAGTAGGIPFPIVDCHAAETRLSWNRGAQALALSSSRRRAPADPR